MLCSERREGFRIRSEWFGKDFENYLCSGIDFDWFMVVSPSSPHWVLKFQAILKSRGAKIGTQKVDIKIYFKEASSKHIRFQTIVWASNKEISDHFFNLCFCLMFNNLRKGHFKKEMWNFETPCITHLLSVHRGSCIFWRKILILWQVIAKRDHCTTPFPENVTIAQLLFLKTWPLHNSFSWKSDEFRKFV